MTSDPADAETRVARAAPGSNGHRRRRIVGAVAVIGLGLGVATWTARRPIATAVIDRTLEKANVQARYRIVDLGLGRQRLADVVIGDPARPDLTATWLELGTRIGLDGVTVTTVRVSGLRVRAAIVDGRLSLGAIDRLLPQSTGAAFRLPAIDLDLADGRIRLTAPPGRVDLTLSGRGRLDDGFRGRARATAGPLQAAGCALGRASAAGTLVVDRGAVTFRGPIAGDRLVCVGGIADRPAIDLVATIGNGLGAWQGTADIRADRVAASPIAARAILGRVTFAGGRAATTGTLSLASGPATARDVGARGLAAEGRFRLGTAAGFAGRIGATGVRLPATLLAPVRAAGGLTATTPVTPLLRRVAGAADRAARDFDVAADVSISGKGATLARIDGVSRSGARAAFVPAAPVRVTASAFSAIDGTARLSGGGLPEATVRFVQAGAGGQVRGVATILPFAADGARLALGPVRFAATGGRVRAETVATLSGPLPDGRIDGLRVPISAEWDGAGTLRINRDCVALSFDRLVIATLRLDAARLPLCPAGADLIRVRDGAIAGGAAVAEVRVSGRLGSTPLALAADDVRVGPGAAGLVAHRIAARLGSGESPTRLDIARLTGSIAGSAFGGRFEGAAGRIGTVPLLLSEGDGGWTFARGSLSLAGAATVADAAPAPRFNPVRAESIALRLAGGAVQATARLVAPVPETPIADVTIAHDLGTGSGTAALAVGGLTFNEGFQPDRLTPLTFGIIADVRGTLTGDARIAWTAQGVTSTGTFRTDRIDLAAAFGPVTGLAGMIHFTDLLAMESAPDQVATVASINPGVPVTDGRIVYRLLPGNRVSIAGGHWPFAGGTLDLRPTLLDLGVSSARTLVFDLAAVDAGQFLQQFNFDNISASGQFDGTLPMIFDADGGRIEGGRLQVRPGGGNIAYLGELTQRDLGIWGNLAFQALRSIDYRDLNITMNGPLAGEMITEVRFAGISQGKGAKSNVLIRRLQKLPFVFNIRIRAPFRGLIDSAQSFYDPSRLVTRNLPALIRDQNAGAAVQPADRDDR